MAHDGSKVPGTWRLTVTLPDSTTAKTIVVFTPEGNVVEIAERRRESSLGVWEPGHEERGFDFTMLAFVHGNQPPLPSTVIHRVHATNSLTNDDNFSGNATLEFLDIVTEMPLVTLKTTHVGVRMQM